MASSYENHEPIFEDFFRIKNAGSSNYRSAAFLPSGKKRPNIKSQPAQILKSSIEYPVSSIVNPESNIKNRESRIEYPESIIENPESSIQNRESTSTTVEDSLQISSFMQNKPNLVRRRRIANVFITKAYKNFIPLAGQKNKPNSNPNKPNLKKAQMNVNLTLTKDYRKKDDFVVRINKPNLPKG